MYNALTTRCARRREKGSRRSKTFLDVQAIPAARLPAPRDVDFRARLHHVHAELFW